jgi:4-diphosphocytidyl-2C-methyl-D-erythritol kinase
MQDDIIIEFKDNYIHARHYGKDSYQISLDLWMKIAAACEEYNCYNILGETYTTNDLSITENYDHIEIFKAAGINSKHRIAWVNHSKIAAEGIKLVETVAKNRMVTGSGGGLFASVDDAKKWLLKI